VLAEVPPAQAAPEHRGKGRPETVEETVARLQRRLESAIAREAYEEAAKLRDRIRELKKETPVAGEGVRR